MIHNADNLRYCAAGTCRIILLYNIEYCIIPLSVDLLAHPALGQHRKEIILHFWRMGSAVIEEERAMHPAYLYVHSRNTVYCIRTVTKCTKKVFSFFY